MLLPWFAWWIPINPLPCSAIGIQDPKHRRRRNYADDLRASNEAAIPWKQELGPPLETVVRWMNKNRTDCPRRNVRRVTGIHRRNLSTDTTNGRSDVARPIPSAKDPRAILNTRPRCLRELRELHNGVAYRLAVHLGRWGRTRISNRTIEGRNPVHCTNNIPRPTVSG